MKKFVDEGERADLDHTGGDGEEREFNGLPKVGLVHKMTSQYVDRYISEPNMINKYNRVGGEFQGGV